MTTTLRWLRDPYVLVLAIIALVVQLSLGLSAGEAATSASDETTCASCRLTHEETDACVVQIASEDHSVSTLD